MSVPQGGDPRFPRKWVAKAYRLMAAGRYALQWLPELIRLYQLTVEEDGEEKGIWWWVGELALTVSPRILYTLTKYLGSAVKFLRKKRG